MVPSNGMTSGNSMTQEPTLLGSSRLAFDQSLLCSSRNGTEALPFSGAKAASVAPQTLNSFGHGLGEQMSQFRVSDLEPVPLQEESPRETKASDSARPSHMGGWNFASL